VDCPNRKTPVDSVYFQNSTVRIHAVAAGPRDGPVIMLLHGFPGIWYGWRKQIEPLATAGFRVIAPDQRGYNLSSKPRGVASYALKELVSDVIAIADQLGQESLFLAGHDWGAAVAWCTALLHPERIAKLVIVNVTHPSVLRGFLNTRPRQMLGSRYILFFQLPWIPGWLLSALHFLLGTSVYRYTSHLRSFSLEA